MDVARFSSSDVQIRRVFAVLCHIYPQSTGQVGRLLTNGSTGVKVVYDCRVDSARTVCGRVYT